MRLHESQGKVDMMTEPTGERRLRVGVGVD